MTPGKYEELERFWPKVNKKGPIHPILKTRCWVWLGGIVDGYGQFWSQGKHVYAHRYCWDIHNGGVSQLQVLHHCDNRFCVNPTHLFLGTNQDNRTDCVAKGRQIKGEQTRFAKLNTNIVLEIRRLYETGKFYQVKLASMFGITPTTVCHIIRRKTWKHI